MDKCARRALFGEEGKINLAGNSAATRQVRLVRRTGD
jgi:hypothetical protein